MILHAMQKWEWIVNEWDYEMKRAYNYCNLWEDLPHIKLYIGFCSFCEDGINKHPYERCKECLLASKLNVNCGEEPYADWVDDINPQENAEIISNAIYEIAINEGFTYTHDEIFIWEEGNK